MSFEVRDLYERYFDQVYKTTFYIVRDLELAKDATQETFIKVFKNLKKLQDPTKVESWIITIATRTAIDFYNIRRKQEQVVDLNEDNFSVEKEMKNADLLDLDQYLNDLNPEQKQVLVLKYFDNLSEKEIASRLKIKVGTVKSRLSRAKKKLLEKHPLGGLHNG